MADPAVYRQSAHDEPPPGDLTVSRVRGNRIMPWACLGSMILCLSLTIETPVRPMLTWNAAGSAPIGLYRVSAPDRLAIGDLVISDLPQPWRALGDWRRYIPSDVPLLKKIAAGAGDRVCGVGRVITINGRPVAPRHERDRAGRRLPWWSGCETLSSGEVLLLLDNPDSFDGRYFGVTPRSLIIGKASLLWRR